MKRYSSVNGSKFSRYALGSHYLNRITTYRGGRRL